MVLTIDRLSPAGLPWLRSGIGVDNGRAEPSLAWLVKKTSRKSARLGPARELAQAAREPV